MEAAPIPPKPNPNPGGGRLLSKRTLAGAPPAAAAAARPTVVTLSWEDEDIENRWGLGLFKGGRFTSVNKTFTFIVAAGISSLFIWLMFVLDRGNSSLHHIGT